MSLNRCICLALPEVGRQGIVCDLTNLPLLCLSMLVSYQHLLSSTQNDFLGTLLTFGHQLSLCWNLAPTLQYNVFIWSYFSHAFCL